MMKSEQRRQKHADIKKSPNTCTLNESCNLVSIKQMRTETAFCPNSRKSFNTETLANNSANTLDNSHSMPNCNNRIYRPEDD